MDFFLKTIHFIKYFKVHLRIKNRDFYPLDFDTGKKVEDVQILELQSITGLWVLAFVFLKN